MYFLTNNEDYIVAASSDFLTAIGSRDVCSISTLLQNKLITIDKEQNRLTISNKNLDYKYETSNMHSAFGNLNLYTLKTISEKSKTDEASTYLEKIQASKVDKKDNEYSIPTIPTLNKEIKEEEVKEEEVKEDSLKENNTWNIDKLVIPKVPDTETNENTEIDKIAEISDATDADIKTENNTLLNELEKIDSKESEAKEINIPKDESIEKLANEIIETKEVTVNEDTKEPIETPETDELTSKIEDIDESVSTKKQSGLKKITKKLFPWGSKKHDDIELEDNYEIDLKTANELKDNKIEDSSVENQITEKTLEDEKLEKNNFEEEIIVEKIAEPELKIDNTDIIKEEIDKKDIENPIVDEEDELAILKEQMNNKVETKIEEEQVSTVIEDVQKDTTEDNSKISYKLIALQVDAIDLKDNANKLSIDTNSYKMLLGNYLDEINKYNFELENGNTSTIEMLKDAGELLSLDILTKKLDNLKVSNNRKEDTKEISLIASLLKDKSNEELTKKDQVVENVISVDNDESIPASIEKSEITAPPVPDEIIDITSAQDLLTSISSQSVAFNPNRAADELNLPKTLILEFVEDFISQSKEHLPIIVDAYKKEDIKTIQTTAHMLKGAASNLRLDSIAENLFKIQKESNITSTAELIKQFVAKVKGLASEVASLEDAEDEN